MNINPADGHIFGYSVGKEQTINNIVAHMYYVCISVDKQSGRQENLHKISYNVQQMPQVQLPRFPIDI